MQEFDSIPDRMRATWRRPALSAQERVTRCPWELEDGKAPPLRRPLSGAPMESRRVAPYQDVRWSSAPWPASNLDDLSPWTRPSLYRDVGEEVGEQPLRVVEREGDPHRGLGTVGHQKAEPDQVVQGLAGRHGGDLEHQRSLAAIKPASRTTVTCIALGASTAVSPSNAGTSAVGQLLVGDERDIEISAKVRLQGRQVAEGQSGARIGPDIAVAPAVRDKCSTFSIGVG